MTRLNVALGALLLAGTSTVAVAQSYPPGPYLGLKGGATFLEDQSFQGRDGNALNFSKETEIGFGVLGVGGYSFGWWRIEGELGFRRIENDKLRIGNDGGIPVLQGAPAQTGTTQNAGGNANAISVMGNVLYDLPWSFAGIAPYIGAGIGMARVEENRTKGAGVNYIDDSDNRFAYQGIAGLNWVFNPKWSMNVEYRYFATSDATFKDALNRPVEGEFKSHNAFVGLTYHFGVPKPIPVAAPPPPPPAAAPPPPPPPPVARPQPFLVFFDFDRSDITVEADRILRAAADAWKRGQSTTLQMSVTGHTDKSGSDAYNQALSVRRANAVKARLTQYGVPANVISTTGRGESEPLVPTADGVREPQNRRAEIVIRQ
jgi:OmpA-OmpF porin, OOP family